MSTTWFVSRDGKQHGPITDMEFRKLVELGHLKGTDFVWHEGAPDWMPGTQFLEGPMADAAVEIKKPGRAHLASASHRSLQPATEASGRFRRGRVVAIAVVVGVVLAVFVAAVAKFATDRALEGLFRTKVDRAAR